MSDLEADKPGFIIEINPEVFRGASLPEPGKTYVPDPVQGPPFLTVRRTGPERPVVRYREIRPSDRDGDHLP